VRLIYVKTNRVLSVVLNHLVLLFVIYSVCRRGDAVAQLVEALCYKSEGSGFDFR